MASNDVRALAERCEVGERLADAYLQHAADCAQCEAHEAEVTEWQNAVTAERVALARAVLAQETRPTCATCRWLQPHTAEDPPMCGYKWNDVGIIGDMNWYCADHQPTPPDQPREDKA